MKSESVQTFLCDGDRIHNTSSRPINFALDINFVLATVLWSLTTRDTDSMPTLCSCPHPGLNDRHGLCEYEAHVYVGIRQGGQSYDTNFKSFTPITRS